MSEEINVMLDQLVDDFRYVLNTMLDGTEIPPQELLEIYNKYFDGV